MPELMDFGKFAQTAIAFSNLQETIRRNDLTEQGMTLEGRRLDLAKSQQAIEVQRNKQNEGNLILNQLDELEKSPFFAGDKQRAASVLVLRGQVLRDKFGLKDVPIPANVNDALGAYEAYAGLYKALGSNNPAEVEGAMTELAVASPKMFKLLLEDRQKAAELPVKLQQMRTLVAMNEEKLDLLKQKKAAAEIQDGLYGLHTAEVRAPLTMLRDPKIEPHFRKLQGMSEEARAAYLRMYPEVAQTLDRIQGTFAEGTLASVFSLQADTSARKFALEKAQAANGQAPQEMADELMAYQTALKAREAEYAWLKDGTSFYDADKYKKVLAEEQNLRIAQGKPRAALTDIANQRLELSKTLRDDKLAEHELKKNEALGLQFAQETYLERLKAGDDDVTAAVAAAKQVKEKYPGVPVDLTKLENPAKKGKSEVTVKMGQEDVSRQFKTIESAQDTLDYVADLSERIKANPAIVGKGAQLGTAVAGAGQQLRAISRLDPEGSKFLNTKPRDEAEALYEVLVYLQAKTMDPTGALDIKVVQHARDVLGDLNSFTTGPAQLTNKLGVVQRNAERRIRNARRRLKGGAESYLTDDNADKPVSQMSEEELMKAIMGGTR